MTPKKKTETKRPIESYEHKDKRRVNNPPVGPVTSETDPPYGIKYGSNLQPFVNKREVMNRRKAL